MSSESAGLARKLGYTNIKVMLKGVPGWKKEGNKVVASDSFVNDGNIVLLDLRSEEEAAGGHIARAVNVPFDELADYKNDINPKAPVVIYGAEVDSAYEMISAWGIKGVSLLDGGLEGYQARGNDLVVGEPATDITWVRKLGKGEVGAEEFLKAAEGDVAGQVVLDVRNGEEVAAGKFSRSMTIPLANLEGRISELPKGKEILVHCSTGSRAEMAVEILKKAGFESRFLVADVVCKGVGECTIE